MVSRIDMATLVELEHRSGRHNPFNNNKLRNTTVNPDGLLENTTCKMPPNQGKPKPLEVNT